jgi:hypothetical protein
MIRALMIAAGAAALTACASIDAQPFSGPNGRQAYSMQCQGFGRTVDGCLRKAGELCPAGYTMVDRTSGTAGLVPMGGMWVAAPRNSMAVECK